MDMHALQTFFMWCTLLNGALLIVSFGVCAFAGGWVYKMHGKWFPIPRETFNATIYAFLALYKLLVLVFNLIPFIALVLMSCQA